MRTLLVCVRSTLAAQSVAACATRLGVCTVRTAVSEAEVLARLAEAPAGLILADTAVTRPDTVGFTRRVLTQEPGAVLVLIGAEDPKAASAAVAAGARGVIRGGDNDPVGTVAKALLLVSASRPATADPPARVSTAPAGEYRRLAPVPPADEPGPERDNGDGGSRVPSQRGDLAVGAAPLAPVRLRVPLTDRELQIGRAHV